jgi:hypothetical protein
MAGWIKGFVSSVLLLVIAGFVYVTLGAVGPFKTLVALLCAIDAAILFLTFIYAIERDDYKSGAIVPFIGLLGFLVAYFGQPPLELTVALSFFVSLFAIIIVQEG